MKQFIVTIILISFITGLKSQDTSRSQFNFKTIDGLNITAKMFKSRKILISTFDASNVDKQVLKMLDSIQRQFYNQVVVIGIPVNDFGTPMDEKSLTSLIKDSLDLSFPITTICQGRPGNDQNPVWRWVMDSTASHFIIKMDTPNQTVIINTQGIIYVYFQENQGLLSKRIKKLLERN